MRSLFVTRYAATAALVVGAALCPPAAIAAEAPIGMVFSVRGAVKVTEPGGATLTPFSGLPAGYVITLGDGGLAALSHYARNQLAVIKGPSKVTTTQDAIKVEPASAVAWSALPQNATIKPETIAQKRTTGDIRVRSLNPMPLAPSEGESVLASALSFQWKGSDKVKISIFDHKGSLLAEEGRSGAYTLTAKTKLEPGKSYSWCVRLDGQASCRPQTSFRVLSGDETSTLANNKPTASAAPGEWAAYGMLAQQLGAYSEASLAAERLLK